MSLVELALGARDLLALCVVNGVTLAVQVDLLLVPGVLDPTWYPVLCIFRVYGICATMEVDDATERS
jgi:hypothetical protein